MKVLVTGGGGFIGSALVHELLEKKHVVRVLALPNEPVNQFDGFPVEVLRGDITKPETLSPAFKGVACVFHLAALAFDWAPWDVFHSVNVLGTRHVIQAAEQSGAARVVHMSSLAVHQYRNYFGADETVPRDVQTCFYGESKKLAEQEVEEAGSRGKVETVIIRPALLPYGPRDPARWGKILEQLEKRRFAFVRKGRAQVGVIHVEDLARGLLLAARTKEAAGEILILSDPVPISWKEIVGTLCMALEVPPPKVSVPYPVARSVGWGMENVWRFLRLPREPLLTRYRVDVTSFDLFFRPAKAQQILGFRTEKEFSEGAREMVAWYCQQKQGT